MKEGSLYSIKWFRPVKRSFSSEVSIPEQLFLHQMSPYYNSNWPWDPSGHGRQRQRRRGVASCIIEKQSPPELNWHGKLGNCRDIPLFQDRNYSSSKSNLQWVMKLSVLCIALRPFLFCRQTHVCAGSVSMMNPLYLATCKTTFVI